MAYAALISLKQTIHRLLHSSHTPIISTSQELLEFAYKHITSLQQFLKESYDSSSKRWKDYDVRIRDAVQKLEDAVEFNVSDQFLSLPHDQGLDFEGARREIYSFVESTTKMKDEYTRESQNPPPLQDEDETDDGAAAVPPNYDSDEQMVGLSDEFAEIKAHALQQMRPYDFGVYSFVGKVESCRTIAARTLFDEIFVLKEQPFDCGAWVTIGRNFQFEQILVSILAQINDHELPNMEENAEKLGSYLYSSLKGRRYMIVVDDVDDVEFWDHLRKLFPEQDNGSLIVLTTGLIEVAQFAKSVYVDERPLFLDDYVWDYVRLVMFGCQDKIDPEFEKAGKKIAEKCGGSCIALAKVILFLFKSEKTPENWSKLAAEEENPVFVVEDDTLEVSKIQEDVHEANEKRWATGALNLSIGIKMIKEYLFPQRYFPKSEMMLFYGMAGVGKTAFIKNIFNDPSILHHYDHRVWVPLGPKYQPEELLIDILAQIYPDIDREHVKRDANLVEGLCSELSSKRCFIVLDDMWNNEPLHHLKMSFPNIRAEIFITSRLLVLGQQLSTDDRCFKVRLLDKEENWDLLRQNVFGRGFYPPELEKAGKKISNNCAGLPLLILTVANLLPKMVAEQKNAVFKDAYDQMHEVFYPSYKYLPQHLQACFLYMGVFSRNHEIPMSKLIALWAAEGFLEPDPSQSVEQLAANYLKEIEFSSLVMAQRKDYDPKSRKTCRLHPAFWHMRSREAKKSKFFETYARGSIQAGLKEQRRVCVRNNILLGINHEHNSMSSDSCIRSVLCTGSLHQYPVPLPYRSSLLHVTDALSIRLYEFPNEVVALIHLRYLALTCDGMLPPSISKLCNLENLIVGRHLSTKSRDNSSILPMEIWSMKELKYLRVTGGNLPNPSCGEVLANLSTLLDVSIVSCTQEVLRGVPNLKKLGVQIQLEPGDDDTVTPPSPYSMFPPGLKKLSLSGLGYPWSYMAIIGRLENLEVLKLLCYAFQGPVWETDYGSFAQLKFLSFEENDLVQWRTRNPSFFSLKFLRIKHCYMLEQLPGYLSYSVGTLQVVDCFPSVLTWAQQMKENDSEKKIERLATVDVHSSWDD